MINREAVVQFGGASVLASRLVSSLAPPKAAKRITTQLFGSQSLWKGSGSFRQKAVLFNFL